MKFTKFLVSTILAGSMMASCTSEPGKIGKIRTQRDSVSYALGMMGASSYKRSIQHFPGNVELSEKGLTDGFTDGLFDSTKVKINEKTANELLQAYMMQVQIKASSADSSATDTAKIRATNEGLKNLADSLSYAIGANTGVNYAKSLEDFPGNIKPYSNAVIAGFRDVMNNDSLKLTLEEAQNTLKNYFADAEKIEALKAAKKAEEDREKNAEWLENNKQKPGVQATASGLQYEILKQGNGATPKATDKVKVHYHGVLTDGTVFDSSLNRGEPAVFPVGAVIRGWTEALQMMPVGSKWKLYIPSELGYGAREIGAIPANSILIFDVELIDIVEEPNN